MVKFAHVADVHIGSWRDPKLKTLSTDAFCKAVKRILELNVDFMLIAGDFFNTALPGIDFVKTVVTQLKTLRKANIPVYVIPGSHDFSSAGKSMLDVLEEAELLVNVCKGTVQDDVLHLSFTTDPKTGVKLTGMLGKRGMLDRKYYEQLNTASLEQEPGQKIFLFHTALSEFKPKEYANMDAHPLSLLPKGFEYYAGGHVHYVFEKKVDEYGWVVYPGPLFPESFSEMEKLGGGGFYIYEDGQLTYEPIKIKQIICFNCSTTNKSPEQVTEDVLTQVSGKEYMDAIVLLRFSGKLSSGKPHDIDFKRIFSFLYEKSAYFVMRNTSQVEYAQLEAMHVTEESNEAIESRLIKEHIGQVKDSGMNPEQEEQLAKQLLHLLHTEKQDGETTYRYEERLKELIDEALDLN